MTIKSLHVTIDDLKQYICPVLKAIVIAILFLLFTAPNYMYSQHKEAVALTYATKDDVRMLSMELLEENREQYTAIKKEFSIDLDKLETRIYNMEDRLKRDISNDISKVESRLVTMENRLIDVIKESNR